MESGLHHHAAAAVLALAAPLSWAQADHHMMVDPGKLNWAPVPSLPQGAQITVIEGPMNEAVPFTVRLKFPANYTIPAHSHPTNENVVVVSGDLLVGMGDTVNKAGASGLGLGGFGMLPANMNHFAFTKQETVITLFGQGPVEFKYVNPADDPRHGPGAKGAK